MRYDLLVCGVGGQGIITLSEIVATAALSKDIKTIVTQEKGLAQRGGSVQAHIRLGEVYSPTMPKRSACGLLSLEVSETFGYLDFLNSGTVCAVSDTLIPSGDTSSKGSKEKSRTVEEIAEDLKGKISSRLLIVEARKRAIELGNPRATNIFMTGVLCGMDPRLTEVLSPEDIENAIRAVVRHNIENNVKVFHEGIEHGKKAKGS